MRWAVPVAAAIIATVPSAIARAQQLNIAQPPRLGPPPSLKIPTVEQSVLPNGLKLYVIEQHEVPLVQLVLSVQGGGGRSDATQPGLASFTGSMLDEGADTLDAFGIAAQAAYLGADLNTGADWDRTLVGLKVPSKALDPAVDLMAAVALRPNFRSDDVKRQRDLRLAGILQQRDEPDVVASLAFNSVVFPAGHPYHKALIGDSAATASLDSAKVRSFYSRTFRPDRASMILSGDISLAEARRVVERGFGSWRAGSAAVPTVGAQRPAGPGGPTAVYLVDKPGAAQSVIVIGNPGVDRRSPDYYALEVMNTLLGGSFSSRLNQNLRETKGYTYGAGSGFAYRPLPGPFFARAAVRSDVTDSSLVEFFREFRRIRDSVVPADELQRAKSFIALQLPGEFETAGDLASQLSGLLVFGLPLEYYRSYIPRIMAVNAADVQRVARKYVRPDRVSIVVVGDVAKIRPGIAALHLGPIKRVDMEGRGVEGSVPPKQDGPHSPKGMRAARALVIPESAN
jgi:zinc protease